MPPNAKAEAVPRKERRLNRKFVMAHQLYESLRFSPSTRAKTPLRLQRLPDQRFHDCTASDAKISGTHARRFASGPLSPTASRCTTLATAYPQRYCRTKLLNLQKKTDALTFVHQYRNTVVFCCFFTFHAAKQFRNGRGSAFTDRFLHQIHWFPGRCCDNATQESADRCFRNVCLRRRKEVWGIAFHVPQWTGVAKEVSQARVTSMSESPSSWPKVQHKSSAAAARK